VFSAHLLSTVWQQGALKMVSGAGSSVRLEKAVTKRVQTSVSPMIP
jgi:hypothetical protein